MLWSALLCRERKWAGLKPGSCTYPLTSFQSKRGTSRKAPRLHKWATACKSESVMQGYPSWSLDLVPAFFLPPVDMTSCRILLHFLPQPISWASLVSSYLKFDRSVCACRVLYSVQHVSQKNDAWIWGGEWLETQGDAQGVCQGDLCFPAVPKWHGPCHLSPSLWQQDQDSSWDEWMLQAYCRDSVSMPLSTLIFLQPFV